MAWSDLPADLLGAVFVRLFPLDHLRFTAVCSPWRSVGLQQKNCYRPRQRNVGLVVPGETADSETRRLLEPVQGQYSNDNVAANLQIPHSYYCCGCSLGWLVLVDDSFDMQLVNPMTGVKFQLPSGASSGYVSRGFDTVGKYTIRKAVLSSDPCVSTSCETIVFILYETFNPPQNRMAFCKLGDTRWTAIRIPEGEDIYRSYDDAIYYKGKFHAIYNGGKPGGVVSCDLSDRDHPIVTDYAPPPTSEEFYELRYLVESNGELFQLRRDIRYDLEKDSYSCDSDEYDDFDEDEQVECDDYEDEVGVEDGHDEEQVVDDDECKFEDEVEYDNADKYDDGQNDEHEEEEEDPEELIRRYRTYRFKIYKLIKCDGCLYGKWKKMDSIGDNSFFVGYNSSFSLSASDYLGCKPNSVYFTDSYTPYENYREPIRHDIGVYNLEDKSIAEVYPMDSRPMRPPPFWFTPIPWKFQLGSKAGQKRRRTDP